jgi:hypothetical protein
MSIIKKDEAKGFNRRSEISIHAEMMVLFLVSTGFGSNPTVTEKNITVPFAISQIDLVSTYFHVGAYI